MLHIVHQLPQFAVRLLDILFALGLFGSLFASVFTFIDDFKTVFFS